MCFKCKANPPNAPVRRLVKGKVNWPMKSFLAVWSWSSTMKRTNASSGTCNWKLRVQFQRGLNPAERDKRAHTVSKYCVPALNKSQKNFQYNINVTKNLQMHAFLAYLNTSHLTLN